MEQHPQAVVLKAGEASSSPLDLLHAEVEALGRTVGCTGPVMVQDLLAPALQGVTEGDDLLDVVRSATDDGLVEEDGGLLRVVGEIDVTDRLLGQPGTEQLVVRVTEAQSEQQAVVSSLVEPFSPFEEQLADPIERVVLPAAMCACAQR